jgi:nitroreductase
VSTYRTIVSKRDTRSYTGEAIADEHLGRIVRAGRMAGSSKNQQPLRFVVVRDPAQAQRLAGAGDYTDPIRNAPLSIAILLRSDQRAFDAGRAAQNMMLAAWELGITSCPVAIHRELEARSVLGHPETYVVAMVIVFGHPQPDVPLGRGAARLPLEELVHHERWESERAPG